METGRIAGIDFGLKRIGVAITDPGQVLVSPLANYSRISPERDAQFFRRLASEERVATFVVGLPVFASGHESPQSRSAREFGKWLANATGVPVEFFDERYSSHQADELLGLGEFTRKQKKARRDMIAAQILLASYLESTRGRSASPEPLDDDAPTSRGQDQADRRAPPNQRGFRNE